MQKIGMKDIFKGFLIGLGINTLITLGISLFLGRGEYYGYVPPLEGIMGSQLNAVFLQCALTGVLGIVFSVASVVIWEREDFNLTKQTVSFFTITGIPFFIVAYFLFWIPRSLIGAAVFILFYLVIFFLIWTAEYIRIKNRIDVLNRELKKRTGDC